MRTLIFDSDDLSAIEVFLNSAYTTMQIGNAGARQTSAHIRRDTLGPVSLDQLDLGFDLFYDADPLEKVCVCAVHSGTIEETYGSTEVEVVSSGEVGSAAPPEPYRGAVRSARYSITMFDPSLLARVRDPADLGKPVRFFGHRPTGAGAGRRLVRAIAHLQLVAASPEGPTGDLVASTLADYLAATVLDVMPTTAANDPTSADRRDARPAAVRRAVSYIETHLDEDLAVADIAMASFVTVRALQLAFRKHLDTTPLAMLRRLRLAAAHEQLRAAVPGGLVTVTSVAYEWGFAHSGRFALAYKRAYGHPPSETLRA
ncbi:helix-turn-helix domain-containing protein [Nocardia colli]|uniref:Helix-turn-helix domain-containing protein n=1 Tax=Nocardia colli TaxID=2545717 RepID=A0A5N0EGS5_9NOCA|nr:AraC family transcriptional regulator [Nocardia colli]KAA8888522.1 helix-turn-helix domain-containing protein [Nocardia colli]